MRGTFPGFAYQLGNLLASGNASIQAGLAKRWGGDYALALLVVACIVAVVVAVFAGFGFEKKGVRFGGKALIRRTAPCKPEPARILFGWGRLTPSASALLAAYLGDFRLCETAGEFLKPADR